VRQLELNTKLAMADTFRAEKKTQKMIDELQLAVSSDPKNFDLRMDLGRALRDSRN